MKYISIILCLFLGHTIMAQQKELEKGKILKVNLDSILEIKLKNFNENDTLSRDSSNYLVLKKIQQNKLVMTRDTKKVVIVFGSDSLKLPLSNFWGRTQLTLYGSGNTVLKIALKQQGSDNNNPPGRLNIYADAVDLKNRTQPVSILSRYQIQSTSEFYKKYLCDQKEQESNKVVSAQSSSFSSVGQRVTPQVDAIAKFLVSRVKKELSIAYFDRFKTVMNKPEYIDFHLLFNETRKQLNLIDENVYDLQPYLNSLRNSAEIDLRLLPVSLPKLMTNETKLRSVLKDNKKLMFATDVCFNLAGNLYQYSSFGKALENMEGISKSNNEYPESLVRYLEIFRLFSFALRDKDYSDTTSYYINSDKIRNLISDTALFECFMELTLAYIKLENNGPEIDTSVYVYVDSIYRRHSDKLKEIFAMFSENLKTIESVKNEKDQNIRFALGLQGMSQLLGNLKPIFQKLDTSSNSEKVFDIIQTGLNIGGSLSQKEYFSTISQILSVYDLLSPESDDFAKIKKSMITYGGFLIAMVGARDEKEFNAILEQFAAPVGSYRSKSINKVTWTLDSYVGIGGAVRPFDHGISFYTPAILGPSVSFSKGTGEYSFSLMASIIDIGPLVAFRFNDYNSQIPDIYLKEIFSPGIIASFGLSSKIPCFVNVGYQRPSQLTKVDTTTNTYELRQINFFSLSFCVNVPLLIVFSK